MAQKIYFDESGFTAPEAHDVHKIVKNVIGL